jgi:hypothetical protein
LLRSISIFAEVTDPTLFGAVVGTIAGVVVAAARWGFAGAAGGTSLQDTHMSSSPNNNMLPIFISSILGNHRANLAGPWKDNYKV